MDWKITRLIVYILFLLICSPIKVQSATEKISIAENLEQNASLSIFYTALKQTDLWAVVQNGKLLSLFVPTDSALENENSAFLLKTVLLSPDNADRLVSSLSYHIVSGSSPLSDNAGLDYQLATLSGECLPIANTGSEIKVGPEASVVESIQSVNGVIYVVDHLLWSPYNGSHCQSPVASGLSGVVTTISTK